VAIFFLIVTFWPVTRAEPIRWWALGMAAVFAAVALLWAPALTPLNKAWTKFGVLLYKMVSPAVMAILFYVTVTPIALLMRLLGKDPLRLRPDRNAKSYWIDSASTCAASRSYAHRKTPSVVLWAPSWTCSRLAIFICTRMSRAPLSRSIIEMRSSWTNALEKTRVHSAKGEVPSILKPVVEEFDHLIL